MSRPLKVALIAGLALAFVLASLGVGRILSARNAEHTVLEQVIRDQAQGRVGPVIAAIDGCRRNPRCVSATTGIVRQVSMPGGQVEILQITEGTKFSGGRSTGVARLAWQVGGRLPVAQCAVVDRTGSVASGFALHVRALSAPIDRTGACPDVAALLARY